MGKFTKKKLANRLSKNDPFNFDLFGKMRICFSSKCMPKTHTKNIAFHLLWLFPVRDFELKVCARARASVCMRVSFGWLSRLSIVVAVEQIYYVFMEILFQNLLETHAWQIVISQTFTCKRHSFDWQSNSSNSFCLFFLFAIIYASMNPSLLKSNKPNGRNCVKFICWLIKSNRLLWLDVMPFIYYYYLTVHKNSLNLILKIKKQQPKNGFYKTVTRLFNFSIESCAIVVIVLNFLFFFLNPNFFCYNKTPWVFPIWFRCSSYCMWMLCDQKANYHLMWNGLCHNYNTWTKKKERKRKTSALLIKNEFRLNMKCMASC